MAYDCVKYTRNQKETRRTYKGFKGVGPDWVERTTNTYNHLFEQPFSFYAVTLCVAIINHSLCTLIKEN